MILTAIIIIILMGCWIHGRRMGLIGLVITTVAYFLAWLMARLGPGLWGPRWLVSYRRSPTAPIQRSRAC